MDIRLENISKAFNDFTAVREVSCHFQPGKIIGLLGPNGAGKTTILRMILNIIKPDSGEVTFDDNTFSKKIRYKIGYLPEERGIYQRYKVIDVLTYLGKLNGLKKRKCHVEIVRLLDRFSLIDILEMQVQQLSKGQQQIVQYIAANLHDPEILILDEPFNGLDPVNQEIFEEHLNMLKENNRTIVLSTHRLAEAENLCDKYLFLNKGQIVLSGGLNDIQRKYSDDIILVDSDEDLSALKEVGHITVLEVNENRAKVRFSTDVNLRNILAEIINTVNIKKIELKKPGLKEIFLSVIQNSRDDLE